MPCSSTHDLSTATVDQKVKLTLDELNLSNQQLTKIMEKMIKEMVKGLGKDTNEDATVKMIPSYVKSLPDGTERGQFLALDLGGTNFRVLLVKIKEADEINGQPKIEMDSQIYRMPENVITGKGDELFDHIALCMADFLKKLDLLDHKLPVGFTFSFPCKQDGLDHATLITWTKGFSASNVVGKDIVKMLKTAIDKRGDLDVDIIAVVNDTVGTMTSCAFDDQECMIGLIVGTGSNACYMEKMSNIERLDSNKGGMCINMEWGAFGDDGALSDYRNEYDVHVDENSLNSGKQLYEKMISGMYMGEIVRLVLVKLTEDGLLFGGETSEALKTPGTFQTSYVSQIESAIPSGMTAVQNILANLGIGAMRADCEVVIQVCKAVSRRAAHLCAAGIAAVARKIKANHPDRETLRMTVGVDGTVYKKHPTFSQMMSEKVDELCAGAGVDVHFALSYDGSGKGAALITAVAQRKIGSDE
uniref:hexokinase-2-like isoform X4 n=1 Tax=Ciona intestinalis TaxID=7719 RepID=UPI00052123F1|nr:hexokinase-2-like isoform X4 [Ciona intestinalis]|eukprot:XP_009857733.1 hexokinase-2-like isoform X4 [Ciona intestinalis]